jgi:hypothetical protein
MGDFHLPIQSRSSKQWLLVKSHSNCDFVTSLLAEKSARMAVESSRYVDLLLLLLMMMLATQLVVETDPNRCEEAVPSWNIVNVDLHRRGELHVGHPIPCLFVARRLSLEELGIPW